MYRNDKRTSDKGFTNNKAKTSSKPFFTKETTIEEKLDALINWDYDNQADNFGNMLIDYMARLAITEEELHSRTKLSVRQISRIRGNKIKDIPLRTVVALCIGMQLEYADSLILVGIAGYSLEKQTEDVQMYKAFLLEADISVEQCNILLIKKERSPLTGKKQNRARHLGV